MAALLSCIIFFTAVPAIALEELAAEIVPQESGIVASENTEAEGAEEYLTEEEFRTWANANNVGIESVSGLTININGSQAENAAGLIMLSNTDPSFYQHADIKVSNSVDIDLTVAVDEKTYQGLGSEDYPFAGKLHHFTDADLKLVLNQSLFNALSDEPREYSAGSLILSGTMSTPIFAGKIHHDASATSSENLWAVSIVSGSTTGGFIGSMDDNARLSLKLNFLGTYNANNSGGIICNTMGSNVFLRLPEGLSLGSGISVAGNMSAFGGISGNASNPTIVLGNGAADGSAIFTKTGSELITVGAFRVDATVPGGMGALFGALTISSKNIMCSGGTAYEYTGNNDNTKNGLANVVNLEDRSSNGFVGGIAGLLHLECSSFEINGGAIKVELHGDNNQTHIGGIIGKLTGTMQGEGSTDLPMLSIRNVPVNYSASNENGYKGAGYFGGIVCQLGDGSVGVYLNAVNCPVQTKTPWAIEGKLGCGGAVSIVESNSVLRLEDFSYDTRGDQWLNGAGLVAFVNEGGAVCLAGIIDLSNTVYATPTASGQLVGKLDRALVYAEEGIDLRRGKAQASNNANDVPDIGTYCSVVRLGKTLLGGGLANDFITIDTTTHAIKISAAWNENAGGIGSDITIGSAEEYAAFAIAIQSHGSFVKNPGDSSIGLSGKNITLTEDIDLTGSGMGQLSRDVDDNAQYLFKNGSFDGGGHELKLAIGEAWGTPNSGNKTPDGRIVNYFQEKSSGGSWHTHVAMFSYCENVHVKDLTIAGAIRAAGVDKASRGDFGVFAATAYGEADAFSFTNVTLSADMDYQALRGDGSKKPAYVGGFVGLQASNSAINFTSCSAINASISTSRDGGTGNISAGLLIGCAERNVTANIIGGSFGGTVSSSGTNIFSGGLVGRFNGTSNSNKCNVRIENVELNSLSVISTNGDNTGGLLGHAWEYTDVTFCDNDETKTGLTVLGESSVISNGKPLGGLCYKASGYWRVPANGIRLQSMNVNAAGGSSIGLLVNQGSTLYLELRDADSYQIESASVSVSKSNNSGFDELVYKTSGGDSILNNRAGIISIATQDSPRLDTGNARTSYINKTTNAATNATWSGNTNSRYYYNIHSFRENPANGAEKLIIWSLYYYAATELAARFFPVSNNTDRGQKYFWGDRIGTHITGSNPEETLIDLTGYSYYPISTPNDLTINPGVQIIFDNASIEAAEGVDTNSTGTRRPSEQNQHSMMQAGLFYQVSHAITLASAAKPLVLSGSAGKGSYGSGAFSCGGYTAGSASPKKTYVLENIVLKDLYITGYSNGSAALLVNSVGQYTNFTVRNITTDSTASTGKYAAETANTSSAWYAAGSLIGTVGSASAKGITLKFENMRLDGRKRLNAGAEVFGTNSTIFARASFLESFAYDSESSGAYNFNLSEDWNGSSHDQKVTYGYEIEHSERNPEEQLWYYQDTNYVNSSSQPNSSTPGDFDNYIKYVYTGENSTNKTHEIDVNVIIYHLIEGCGRYMDPYIIKSAGELQTLAAYLYQDGQNPRVGWEVNYGTGIDDCGANEVYKHVKYTYDETQGWVGTDNSIKTKTEMSEFLRSAYYVIQPASGDSITLRRQFMGLGTDNRPFRGVIIGKNNTLVLTNPDGSGLVRCSEGCVIKDLNISVNPAGGTITPDESKRIGFAIADVKYGESLIDNVSVSFAAGSSFSAANSVAIGGIVGLVRRGGVIFRNMPASAPILPSSSSRYWNPYVGRVLDGYAISEGCSIDNTNKNYKIPEIIEENGLPVFTESGAEIDTSQALFLLSAMINSYCMDRDDWYWHRGMLSYNDVGKTSGTENIYGEALNYSYLYRKYVLNGAASGPSWNGKAALTGTGELDMSGYGTGFRGIGKRYNEGYTVNLSSFDGANRTIRIAMSVQEETSADKQAIDIGLFNVAESLSIEDLTVTGSIGCSTGNSPNVGALIGQVKSGNNIITNCIMRANVSGGSNTGGMIGLQMSNTTINDCVIQDITITPHYNGFGGGIIGDIRDGSATVNNTLVNGINVYGAKYQGGMIGEQEYKGVLNLTNSTVSAVKIGFNGAGTEYGSSTAQVSGGVVGYSYGSHNVTNLVVQDNYVVAKQDQGNGGAYIGCVEGDKTINVTDVSFINNRIFAQDQGIISGKLKATPTVSINNLYAKDNLFPGTQAGKTSGNWNSGGYGIITGSADGSEAIINACNIYVKWAEDPDYPAKAHPSVWIGWANGRNRLKLVGVTVVGAGAPEKEFYDSGIVLADTYIIYADHDGAGAPEGDRGVKVTSSPLGYVTIGGVQLYGDAVITGQALKIFENALTPQGTVRSGYKAILKTEDLLVTNFTTFNARKNNVLENDFQVMLVNKNKAAEIDAMVQAYLNLMTNGGWEKIKSISGVNVDVTSYEYADGEFEALGDTERTLSYAGGTFTPSNITDGDSNRFTLITITVPDPTGGAAYKLYVPIMVERPIQIRFSAEMVTGTQFDDEVFLPATESYTYEHGRRFTLRVEYFYDYAWGEYYPERMNWSFARELKTPAGETNVLPAGTKLTLIDVAGGNIPYTTTLDSAMGEVDIYELFSLATPHTLKDLVYMDSECPEDFGEKWRIAAESEAADITIDGTGYKRATDGTLYLRCKESFFIVIETPAGGSFTQLQFTSPDGLTGQGGGQVLNNIVHQKAAPDTMTLYRSITLDTERGLEQLNAQVASGNTEIARTDNTVSLCVDTTVAGPMQIISESTTHRYLEFAVHMKHFREEIGSLTSLPNTQITAKFYYLNGNVETEIEGSEWSGVLPMGSKEFRLILKDAYGNPIDVMQNTTNIGDDKTVTVRARFDLGFAQDDITGSFPAGATSDVHSSPDQYARFDVLVSMADDIHIVSGKQSENSAGETYYYRSRQVDAELVFTANDRAQLGINPASSEEEPGGSTLIEATGLISFESQKNPQEVYGDMVCTLKLLKKGDGHYEPIGEDDATLYIKPGSVMLNNQAASGNSKHEWTWLIPKGYGLYNADTKTVLIPVSFEVLRNVSSYRNYQMELTVSFKNADNTNPGALVLTDHIIYNYSRIPVYFMEEHR